MATLSGVFQLWSTEKWFTLPFFWRCPGTVELAHGYTGWLFILEVKWGIKLPTSGSTGKYLNHWPIQLYHSLKTIASKTVRIAWVLNLHSHIGINSLPCIDQFPFPPSTLVCSRRLPDGTLHSTEHYNAGETADSEQYLWNWNPVCIQIIITFLFLEYIVGLVFICGNL